MAQSPHSDLQSQQAGFRGSSVQPLLELGMFLALLGMSLAGSLQQEAGPVVTLRSLDPVLPVHSWPCLASVGIMLCHPSSSAQAVDCVEMEGWERVTRYPSAREGGNFLYLFSASLPLKGKLVWCLPWPGPAPGSL